MVILLFLICVRLEAKTKGHRTGLEIAGAVRRAFGYMLVAAVRISGTSVTFYETTRRNKPEDSHFHSAPREPQMLPTKVANLVKRLLALPMMHSVL